MTSRYTPKMNALSAPLPFVI